MTVYVKIFIISVFILTGNVEWLLGQARLNPKDTVSGESFNTVRWKALNDEYSVGGYVIDEEIDFAGFLYEAIPKNINNSYVQRHKTRLIFKRYTVIHDLVFEGALGIDIGVFFSWDRERYLTFNDGFAIGSNVFKGGLRLDKFEFQEADSLAKNNGIGSNEMPSLEIWGAKGDNLLIVQNQFREFTDRFADEKEEDENVEKKENGAVDDSDDEIIFIERAAMNSLTITQNKFAMPKVAFNLENSLYRETLEISHNQFASSVLINILNDSISKEFVYKDNKAKFHQLVLTNCFIDAPIVLQKSSAGDKLSLTFVNCSFGLNTSMENIEADTIKFQKCVNFPYAFPLTTANSGQTVLTITNSKVDNLLLDYSEKFKLVPRHGSSSEEQISTYETMLEKFRKEGRLVSFRNLDIEYSNFKYDSLLALGGVRKFVDKVWWNYGHSKLYILWWTLGFLVLFMVLNYWKWKEMHDTYNALITERDSANGTVGRSFVNTLLYTSLIFFTLRIDFEKFRFRKQKYVFLFFVQYLTGLVCMFFIFNAILKIG